MTKKNLFLHKQMTTYFLGFQRIKTVKIFCQVLNFSCMVKDLFNWILISEELEEAIKRLCCRLFLGTITRPQTRDGEYKTQNEIHINSLFLKI